MVEERQLTGKRGSPGRGHTAHSHREGHRVALALLHEKREKEFIFLNLRVKVVKSV